MNTVFHFFWSSAENTAGTRAALANAELRAPFAGPITNLNLKVGEFAASGTPVVAHEQTLVTALGLS